MLTRAVGRVSVIRIAYPTYHNGALAEAKDLDWGIEEERMWNYRKQSLPCRKHPGHPH